MYLIRERQLAPSSLEIAVCALRFLYKVTLKKSWSFDDVIPPPKKPRRLPVVLSPDEEVISSRALVALADRPEGPWTTVAEIQTERSDGMFDWTRWAIGHQELAHDSAEYFTLVRSVRPGFASELRLMEVWFRKQ